MLERASAKSPTKKYVFKRGVSFTDYFLRATFHKALLCACRISHAFTNCDLTTCQSIFDVVQNDIGPLSSSKTDETLSRTNIAFCSRIKCSRFFAIKLKQHEDMLKNEEHKTLS